MLQKAVAKPFNYTLKLFCRRQNINFCPNLSNSLKTNNTLNVSKLKVFADEQNNCGSNVRICFRKEIGGGKGENASYLRFLPFTHFLPTCLPVQCCLPFPNKTLFLRVCSTRLLKTLWQKEKFLVTSNFSFSHSVSFSFGEHSAIFIKLKIVICKLFQFGRV